MFNFSIPFLFSASIDFNITKDPTTSNNISISIIERTGKEYSTIYKSDISKTHTKPIELIHKNSNMTLKFSISEDGSIIFSEISKAHDYEIMVKTCGDCKIGDKINTSTNLFLSNLEITANNIVNNSVLRLKKFCFNFNNLLNNGVVDTISDFSKNKKYYEKDFCNTTQPEQKESRTCVNRGVFLLENVVLKNLKLLNYGKFETKKMEKDLFTYTNFGQMSIDGRPVTDRKESRSLNCNDTSSLLANPANNTSNDGSSENFVDVHDILKVAEGLSRVLTRTTNDVFNNEDNHKVQAQEQKRLTIRRAFTNILLPTAMFFMYLGSSNFLFKHDIYDAAEL